MEKKSKKQKNEPEEYQEIITSKVGRSPKKSPKKNIKIEVNKPVKKVLPKFNLVYIYRRESYTLQNLLANFLISGIKKLISKKLEIEITSLKFYYMDKELKEDKNSLNAYEYFKQNGSNVIEVKKELPPKSDNITSLNTKVLLPFKVRCTNVSDYKGLVETVEKFMKEYSLESNFLCEPVAQFTFEVSFSCRDHCYLFKRFIMKLKRTDKNYEKSDFEFIEPDKYSVMEIEYDSKIDENKEEENYKKKIEYSGCSLINLGPYLTGDDLRRMDEKENKKKWISKRGFK